MARAVIPKATDSAEPHGWPLEGSWTGKMCTNDKQKFTVTSIGGVVTTMARAACEYQGRGSIPAFDHLISLITIRSPHVWSLP